MPFIKEHNAISFRFDSETLRIEAWGPNAIRVRATHQPQFPAESWALEEPVTTPEDVIVEAGVTGSIKNGDITATISARGKIVVSNNKTNKTILEEYSRHRLDLTDPKCSALQLQAREFVPRLGNNSWRLTARFESLDPEERIYGMGQYQQPNMNLKGAQLELAQRNSQASVPFAVSNLGYGLLWNNPSIGRAMFGTNLMTFEAASTNVLDYWIVTGDSPASIVRAYTDVTGKVPEMPEYGLGFWQCKLRYQTQEEILQVAREHKKRGLPMDVIVVDFFHWPKEGEWKFDPTFWPDPDAMIRELKSLGIECMVSVWPTVDRQSENYDEMLAKGLLIRQDRGWRLCMEGPGNTIHFDATNPEARRYVWQKVKEHYYNKGIRVFWLDEAEPEYTVYDFDIYRYHRGPNLMIGNWYPRDYAKGFYEGMKSAGQDKIVNLVRCAWAGSQKYGALLWSGDIASSWRSFRDQLSAGLNAGLAGISWWTTDIGGFHGGDPNDPAFRELFVRWFQWAAFCPVMRLHGDREPRQPQLGNSGGSHCRSGAANEVWSYGDEVYDICRTYLGLREKMRVYVRDLMKAAHEHGDPLMRPLFYDFPEDGKAWEIEDEYMFGSKYLVAPVLKAGKTESTVYLPKTKQWRLVSPEGDATGDVLQGGSSVTVSCPLSYMPVFEVV